MADFQREKDSLEADLSTCMFYRAILCQWLFLSQLVKKQSQSNNKHKKVCFC